MKTNPTREALRRQAILDEIARLQAERGLSQNSAARTLGESPATISRWRAAAQSAGPADCPEALEALQPKYENCGRPAKFSLSLPEARALRLLRLQTGSLALAVEEFAEHESCRPQTRAAIMAELDHAARRRRQPNWPLSLRQAGHVTVEEEALFRGPKHFGEVELVERRGNTWIDEEGSRHVLAPNSIWESDDMSLNEPFSYTDPETGRIRTGRQTLCTIDVFSAAWLGATPIGRDRDAYRMEDIADFMWHCVQAHGLPLLWRLERGCWENTFVDGVPIPGTTSETWGGLDGVMRIVHTFKSRGKGLIESSFNLLQDLTAHRSLTIGRSRGEFEAATKAFLRAGRGNEREASKFWEIGQAADELVNAMERFNLRPKTRRAFGRDTVVPADLYREAPMRRCPESEAWRFLPIKRMATVRQGCIECVVDHYPLPFRFRLNGCDGIYLEHGHSVFIAFHPGRPMEGCHVFNAERGTRNRDGMAMGQRIGLAVMAEDAPQINLRPEAREFSARKNANAAVRTEFREIAKAGGREPAVSRSEVRDGWGQSAEIRRGGRAVASDDATVTPRSGRGSNRIEETFTDEDMAELEARERAAIEALGIV